MPVDKVPSRARPGEPSTAPTSVSSLRTQQAPPEHSDLPSRTSDATSAPRTPLPQQQGARLRPQLLPDEVRLQLFGRIVKAGDNKEDEDLRFLTALEGAIFRGDMKRTGTTHQHCEKFNARVQLSRDREGTMVAGFSHGESPRLAFAVFRPDDGSGDKRMNFTRPGPVSEAQGKQIDTALQGMAPWDKDKARTDIEAALLPLGPAERRKALTDLGTTLGGKAQSEMQQAVAQWVQKTRPGNVQMGSDTRTRRERELQARLQTQLARPEFSQKVDQISGLMIPEHRLHARSHSVTPHGDFNSLLYRRVFQDARDPLVAITEIHDAVLAAAAKEPNDRRLSSTAAKNALRDWQPQRDDRGSSGSSGAPSGSA